MSIVDEVAIWSAIAGRMTIEMELTLAQHAESRGRNELIIAEAEAYIWLMRRAAGEWQRALGFLRREYDGLSDRIAEGRRRAQADYEVEEMRRQKETRDSATALRREVESLSALRDRLRDEVGSLSQSQSQSQQQASQRSSAMMHSGAAADYANTINNKGLVSTSSVARDNNASLNLGSPIPHHSAANHSYGGAAHQQGASSTGSLGVLRSVRDQLRDIRENNNISPPRGATPQRSSSPSAQQWKERLSKLQGDLRTLRTELGATPVRPAPAGGY